MTYARAMIFSARLAVIFAASTALLSCGESTSNPSDKRDAGTENRDGGKVPSPRYEVTPDLSCKGLFGAPNAKSGLDDGACTPVCLCGEKTWSPPAYDAAFIASLRAFKLVEPYAEVTKDPYAEASPATADGDSVCGVVREKSSARDYRLVSYPDPEAARTAGAFITHTGRCGVCSTLEDLAVYLERNDLTEPVRQCGLDHLTGSMDEHVACLRKLGFTLPCAEVWYFNTLHTKAECASECFSAIDAPYHLADGSLHPCLQCDEDKSGPVFKAVAGRTRRNSGIANALCRPCGDVSRVEHVYE